VGRNNLAAKVDVITRNDLEAAFNLKEPISFIEGSSKPPAGAALMGEVNIPTLGPEDAISGTNSAGAHAMHLRLEHLFDQVDHSIPDTYLAEFDLQASISDSLDVTSNKLTSKPVVIGDALPFPVGCPESVEQLLEAALAHHNLGSYDEALKFLEASRIQLLLVEKHLADSKRASAKAGSGSEQNSGKAIPPSDKDPDLPIDLYAYITICKGNVYQSCGDDENSLLQYFECLSRCQKESNAEWEMICLNNIAMVAYYNMKYSLALKCFAKVVEFREEVKNYKILLYSFYCR